MPSPPRLPRIDRLSASDWLLAGEALFLLVWASLAIGLLPFRKVAAAASKMPARRAGRPAEGLPKRIRWAVDVWGRRVPWRAVCFQRALAAHRMLRRRGYGSILHYGVAQGAEKGLSAHVWVSLDGKPIIGGEEAPNFTCLATFPPDRA